MAPLPKGTSPNPIYFGQKKGKGPGGEAAGAPALAGGRCREGYFAPGRSGSGLGAAGARCPGEGGGGSRRGGGRSLTCAASSFVSCSGLGRIWTFSGRWRRHLRNLRRDRQRPWAGAPSPPGTPGQGRARRLRSLRQLRPKVSLRSRRGRGPPPAAPSSPTRRRPQRCSRSRPRCRCRSRFGRLGAIHPRQGRLRAGTGLSLSPLSPEVVCWGCRCRAAKTQSPASTTKP